MVLLAPINLVCKAENNVDEKHSKQTKVSPRMCQDTSRTCLSAATSVVELIPIGRGTHGSARVAVDSCAVLLHVTQVTRDETLGCRQLMM